MMTCSAYTMHMQVFHLVSETMAIIIILLIISTAFSNNKYSTDTATWQTSNGLIDLKDAHSYACNLCYQKHE